MIELKFASAPAGSRDVLCGPEHRHQKLQAYSKVQNPQEIADDREEQAQQPLRSGGLEPIEHIPRTHDQAQKEMNPVEKLGIFLGNEMLKGKVQKALEETLPLIQMRRLQDVAGVRHTPSLKPWECSLI